MEAFALAAEIAHGLRSVGQGHVDRQGVAFTDRSEWKLVVPHVGRIGLLTVATIGNAAPKGFEGDDGFPVDVIEAPQAVVQPS